MSLNELFWKSSESDRKRGYSSIAEGFICLLCGAVSERGIIYNNDGVLCDAEKNIILHIVREHGSVFEYIVGLDRRLTGLSEHQRSLMKLFYKGLGDAQIQKELRIGSASTIRQHRFALKEKERQAKIFTVLAELMNSDEPLKRNPGLVGTVPAKGVENGVLDLKNGADSLIGSSIDNSEREKVIKKYFPESGFGRLKTFAMKEKSRMIVLGHIASNFKSGVMYSEKEVNSILLEIFDDYVTLKRYLIDYGFMGRKTDGSFYWLIKRDEKKGDESMELKKSVKSETAAGAESEPKNESRPESRKEMKRQYKEMKQEGGVYQIRNTVNKKILLLATPDLKTVNGKLMQLRTGSYLNEELQRDWNRYGEAAFVVEVLEAVNKDDENFRSKLEKIEKKWFEKLDPYGERGYNVPGRRY
ncbi:MAG TPA: DUF2087 domain-containing protein [Candidatus Wallbacteria bacterium]|nr:DUF2087 domain-containing protein [Candidatus Wallbacteria bacterium]